MSDIQTVTLENPYQIPKMGTSGLRLTQEAYGRPGFLEQFAQGIAEYFREETDKTQLAKNNKTILLGGDPRQGNNDRIKIIAGILAAAGFKVIVAGNGLASTPSMSHGIRKLEVAGGVILTASHNPYTDVGIKINTANGAPALEDTVNRVHALQNETRSYSFMDYDQARAAGLITDVDIIAMYADLLDSIFDFASMKSMLAGKSFKGAFDSMHGAAGPFAREIFINRLGLDCTMLREEPRADLGGHDAKGEPLHPEPDFDYIPELINLNTGGGFNIVAAWDSDVDRRLDGGSGFFLESADEFALFAKYSELINVDRLFDDTIYFCRSTVTADPCDRMQKYLQQKFAPREVKTVETPTGFKWIADLGNWGVEESNGVGNPYLREKDGIFATVMLLKIILVTGKTPKELMEDIWGEFGRVYFTRGEVSGSDSTEKDLLTDIFNNSSSSVGKDFGGLKLEEAGAWDYIHPRTHQLADKNAAWVLKFSDGNTIKARFSGTGSGGYTLRVYCSKFDRKFDMAKSGITVPMKKAFDAFLQAHGFKGAAKKYTDAHQPDLYA